MCEAFLRDAQKDPTRDIGKSIVFAVNQTHATNLTKIFNELQPGLAVTITSRIPDASSIAKEFRDGKRPERIAVSVDMLSTGYNCRDLLNIGLMRPIFSPTEYIQIKGRGTGCSRSRSATPSTRRRTSSCSISARSPSTSRKSTTTQLPLKMPREREEGKPQPQAGRGEAKRGCEGAQGRRPRRRLPPPPREIPVWEGTDTHGQPGGRRRRAATARRSM